MSLPLRRAAQVVRAGEGPCRGRAAASQLRSGPSLVDMLRWVGSSRAPGDGVGALAWLVGHGEVLLMEFMFRISVCSG